MPTESNKQNKLEKKLVFVGILKVTNERAEYGSIIKCTDPLHGSGILGKKHILVYFYSILVER